MPTPETDAFKLDANWSPTEWFKFARRLERERDEWKRKFYDVREALCDALPESNHPTMELVGMLTKERDELLQVIRDVDWAFPDLAEFQDKNGRSLKWLADKIQKAKGEA